MLISNGIIKSAMNRRGFAHHRLEDQFSISGEYARNLQFVYSKDSSSKRGGAVDLVYFAVDLVAEKMVVGYYRENPKIENGVLINKSRSLPLQRFNAVELDRLLNHLVVPSRDSLKKERKK